jgi:hypothetical protein
MLRLLSIAAGYGAAALAAGLVIGLGLHGPALGWSDAGWFAGWVLLAALSVAVFALLPSVAAIALAEKRGLRSLLPWSAFGAVLGLAAHVLVAFTGDPAGAAARLSAFGIAGLVAGFVYWIVAGRLSGAGLGRGSPPA